MAEPALIELRDVSIGYDNTRLVDNIHLDINASEFIGLVGPNGAGKSTLLKTIMGSLKPLQGTVWKRPGLRLGYVPQRTRIDPIYPLTALDVVRLGGMGPKPNGKRRSSLTCATQNQGAEALERLGIQTLWKKPFRDLSFGQQQRVLIARALVRSPDLLILDEPTAGMDLPSEQRLLDFITSLNQKHHTNIVLVVHQLSLVAGRVSTIALINKDLPLFAVGPAETLLSSERLTTLYQFPMEVVETGGRVAVQAASSPKGAP